MHKWHIYEGLNQTEYVGTLEFALLQPVASIHRGIRAFQIVLTRKELKSSKTGRRLQVFFALEVKEPTETQDVQARLEITPPIKKNTQDDLGSCVSQADGGGSRTIAGA
ncbi:hypothetical protein RF11_09021 [Thelohanellus kitauei]|uniref:Uncharacterized protein n=1 Tax=Thelohanellus kitauei TaxID=669202 RepID=A0A0C2NDA5_THEKT|nr:hypothetical protein RF11_09021 [Thelohanellus kitauei]